VRQGLPPRPGVLSWAPAGQDTVHLGVLTGTAGGHCTIVPPLPEPVIGERNALSVAVVSQLEEDTLGVMATLRNVILHRRDDRACPATLQRVA
jgi:hypothetical protein